MAVLFVGCGGKQESFLAVFDPCEPLVLAPEDATAAQLESVSDAVEMWNAVAATKLTLDSHTGGPASSIPIRFVDSNIYLGKYDDEALVINLARRVDERHAMAVVLAHELGHAFNLYHVKGRSSVMNSGNHEIEPLETDVAALEAEWGPCVYR